MKNLNDPTITAFKTKSGSITACNLLHCYLEFQILVPEIEDWVEGHLIDNPPRLYRLKQLNAMLRAFEIDDLYSFKEGRFIEHENSHKYAQAHTLVSDGKISSTNSNDLTQCFLTLMQYRQEVENVLCFGSGAYHINPELLSNTYRKIWQLSWQIKENIVGIDTIIATIINPEEKSFSVEILVRDYGFPDVDITQLDLDWL